MHQALVGWRTPSDAQPRLTASMPRPVHARRIAIPRAAPSHAGPRLRRFRATWCTRPRRSAHHAIPRRPRCAFSLARAALPAVCRRLARGCSSLHSSSSLAAPPPWCAPRHPTPEDGARRVTLKQFCPALHPRNYVKHLSDNSGLVVARFFRPRFSKPGTLAPNPVDEPIIGSRAKKCDPSRTPEDRSEFLSDNKPYAFESRRNEPAHKGYRLTTAARTSRAMTAG